LARSIAIVSLGKGVGKTTISINLAIALHNMGFKVLLFDTDFTHNNLLEHLDIHHMPIHLGQALDGDVHVNDSIYKHYTGIKILPSSKHSYDKFSYVYQDILADHDFIILDTPSIQENLEIVLKNSDEAIIVHTPEYSSKIVNDAIELLSKLKIVNLGIVLNKSSERGTQELFKHPILEKITNDKNIEKSYNIKSPSIHTNPNSENSKKIKRLAKRLG
jgi:MinD-like ATPase involved in chromosome partitioning or flagellar assembly